MSGMVSRRRLFLRSSLLFLGFLLGAKSDTLPPEKIIKRWKDGPVRYLMAGKEEEALGGLKSTEELARFITAFWARRDPSRGTFENEYRRMFWQRVSQANTRFRVSTTSGWKTDRGKIFIILGEPFDIETTGGATGDVRWSYRRQHTKTANPEFYVVFSYSRDGELKLNSSSRALSPYYDFQGLVSDPGAIALGEAEANVEETANVPAGPKSLVDSTAVQANFDLGDEMIEAGSNTKVILATVSARDFLSAFAATTKFEFFRAHDGSTFVNICGLMKAEDLYGGAVTGISHHRMYVSLSPLDASAQSLYATNEKNPSTFDLSKGPEPGGVVAVWTGVAVPPGRYQVTMAIEDSLAGRLGRATAALEVPDFSTGLSLSTPVLASALTEAQDRMGVTARSSGVFRRSEDFGIYYEVYGLAEHTDSARFDASYQFYRETPQGAQPLGRAVASRERTGASQGWSFPLAKWPAGKYQLLITVTEPGGGSTTAQTTFEVVE